MMRYFKTSFITAVLAMLPLSQAQAHPHLFVAVEITIVFDGEQPTGVRMGWSYDDYFSLLVTSDLGLDIDGDLALTDAEQQTLADAVAGWATDFSGELDVFVGNTAVTAAKRVEHGVGYTDGHVFEKHLRPLVSAPVVGETLAIRVYDPFYYVSYTIDGPIRIEGRDDCKTAVQQPDLNAAYSLVDEFLYGRPAADVGAEEQIPEVGLQFAETIFVTCGT